MPDKLVVGGNPGDGQLSVVNDEEKAMVELISLPDEAIIAAGNEFRPGRLTLYNSAHERTAELRAADATLHLGGSQTNGVVSVRGFDGQKVVELIAMPTEGVIGVGRKARAGRMTMYNHEGEAAIELRTEGASLAIGGGGQDATVSVRTGDGATAVFLDAGNAAVIAGGDARNGMVSVRGANGTPRVELFALEDECVIGAGNDGRPGRISVFDAAGNEAIRLDGATGDIFVANADCAEEFDCLDNLGAGTVVVLDDEGGVVASRHAYDRRVAGVISGAGSYRAGIVLDRRATGRPRLPVALMGKVFCLVDATRTPVRVGDLLTTSDVPGHAMGARDRRRSFGSILGKALAPLAAGCGLVPVLVTLR